MKKLSLLLSVISLLIAGYIYIGSRDADFYDDHGLLNRIQAIPDHDNGYEQISFMNQEGYSLLTSKQRELIQDHLEDNQWDSTFVDSVLKEHKPTFVLIDQVLARPKFDMPLSLAGVSINVYQQLVDLNRLLMLKIHNQYRQDELSNAIVTLDKLMRLIQTVKLKANPELITYMIGIRQQYEALSIALILADNADRHVIRQILTIVHQIPNYKAENYAAVYATEFFVSQSYYVDSSTNPLLKRLEKYHLYWLSENALFKEKSSFEYVRAFLNALFPKFYQHKNRELDAAADVYKSLVLRSEQPCQLQDFGQGMLDQYLDTTSFLKIHSEAEIRERVREMILYSQSYHHNLRCFSHSHLEATKAILALKLYQIEYGDLPQRLSELVPDYLSALPVDAFDGQPLRYNVKQAYLYSVGANFKDDGGSVDSAYTDQCDKEDQCRNNPTFLLSIGK